MKREYISDYLVRKRKLDLFCRVLSLDFYDMQLKNFKENITKKQPKQKFNSVVI